MEYTYGFIGAGNMGGALAQAVVRTVGGKRVMLSCRSPKNAETRAAALGCAATDNIRIAESCDYIFLGVKPQMMAEALEGIAPRLAARQKPFVLVTMAAGLTCERISELAGGSYPVIRIMPNTPASIGKGMILATRNGLVSDEIFENLKSALCAAGTVDELEERLIDAGSALSGCGPAFVYLFIEALADGGVACGLSRSKAVEYAAETVAGSAAMVLETGLHPGQLKDAVCSPAGSTIEGVGALEEHGFRAAAISAVKAAFNRTKALGK